MFFDATKAKPSSPRVRPTAEQDERESQRLWEKTARAVRERNHEVATDEKTKIEDRQREEAARRAQDDVEWHPRLFRRVHGGPGGAEEGEEDLEWIINATVYVSRSRRFAGAPLTRGHSDSSASPDEQTEQILSIYPIVKGQEPAQQNAIPPRKSGAPSASDDKADDEAGGRLVDVGGEAPSRAQKPTQAGEIEELLVSTGKPADGPLLDFADDLKQHLPEGGERQ